MRRNALSGATLPRSVLPSPSLTARSLDDALCRLRRLDPRGPAFPTPFGLTFGAIRRGSNVPGPIEALRRLAKRSIAVSATPRPSIPPPPVSFAPNPRPQPVDDRSGDSHSIDIWAERIFGSFADTPSLEPEPESPLSDEPLGFDHLHTIDDVRAAIPRLQEKYPRPEFGRVAFQRLCEAGSAPEDLFSFLQDPALTSAGSFCFSALLMHATRQDWRPEQLNPYPEVLERGIALGLLTLREVCDLPRLIAESPLDANPQLLHITCRRVYWALCTSRVMEPNINILYQLLALLEPLPWGLSSIKRDIRAHLTRLLNGTDQPSHWEDCTMRKISMAHSYTIKSNLDQRLDKHGSPSGTVCPPVSLDIQSERLVSETKDPHAWFDMLEASVRRSLPTDESAVSNEAFDQLELTTSVENPVPGPNLPPYVWILRQSQRARCMSRPEDVWSGLSGSDPMSVCRMMFQFWDQNDFKFRHGQRRHMLRKARFFFETSPRLARQSSGAAGVDEMFNLAYSTLSAGSTETSRTLMDVYRLTRSMYGYVGAVALSERIWEYWPAADKWLLLRDILACLAGILPWRNGFRLSDPELQPFITNLHGFFRNRVFEDSENQFHQPEPWVERYHLPIRSATVLQYVLHDIATAVASDVRGRSRGSLTTIRHCYFQLLRYKLPVLRSLPIALVQVCIIQPIVNGTGYTETVMKWVVSIVRRYESDGVAESVENLARSWQISAWQARRSDSDQGYEESTGAFTSTEEAEVPQRVEGRNAGRTGDSTDSQAPEPDLISNVPATATEPENHEHNKPAGGIQDPSSDSSPNFIFCRWPPLRRTGRNWVIVGD
jgi:hypothetical protein